MKITEYSVIFSVVALPLTFLPILLVANDPAYMGRYRNGPLANVLGIVYFVVILRRRGVGDPADAAHERRPGMTRSRSTSGWACSTTSSSTARDATAARSTTSSSTGLGDGEPEVREILVGGNALARPRPARAHRRRARRRTRCTSRGARSRTSPRSCELKRTARSCGSGAATTARRALVERIPGALVRLSELLAPRGRTESGAAARARARRPRRSCAATGSSITGLIVGRHAAARALRAALRPAAAAGSTARRSGTCRGAT